MLLTLGLDLWLMKMGVGLLIVLDTLETPLGLQWNLLRGFLWGLCPFTFTLAGSSPPALHHEAAFLLPQGCLWPTPYHWDSGPLFLSSRVLLAAASLHATHPLPWLLPSAWPHTWVTVHQPFPLSPSPSGCWLVTCQLPPHNLGTLCDSIVSRHGILPYVVMDFSPPLHSANLGSRASPLPHPFLGP